MIKRLLIVASLGLVLAGCVHVPKSAGGGGRSATTGSKNDPEQTSKAVVEIEGRFVKGQRAPKVVVESFEGTQVDMSQWYGEKAVVLDFWAGWCPFCIAEMPELEKAHRKYGEDLVMVGVHRTDTEPVSTGAKFAQERGVSYLLVKDSDGSIYRATGGLGMPVAVFIDKSGIVTEIKSGPKTTEEIEEKVEDLFL